MGAIVHMETEEVYHVINQMRQTQNNIMDRVDTLTSRVVNLDWDGRNRDQFVQRYQTWKQVAESRLETLQALANALAQEREQWLRADQDGANGIAALMVNASVTSAVSGLLWWLTEGAWQKKKEQYSIDDAWDHMAESDSGKELLKLAKEKNIKFILPGGRTIGDGENVVEIRIEDISKTQPDLGNAEGYASPGLIVIDQDVMDRMYGSPDKISEVLAHEIQHQVDQEQGLLPDGNSEIIINDLLNQGKYDEAEKSLREAIQKYLDSEARARQRGLEVDRGFQLFENVFDNDGVASPNESWTLMNIYGYETFYETQYNNIFPDFRVDVWVDLTGQVQCDIVKITNEKQV